MKHLFKIYIVLFVLISDFKLYAQPGDDDDNGDLEGDDPQVPINGKLYLLLFVGVIFAFYYFKNYHKLTTQK